jgi:hypothetical protein
MHLSLLLGLCSGAAAGAEPPTPGTGRVILDTYSYWRVHVTLRPVVFGSQNDAKPNKLASGPGRPVLPLDGPKTELPPTDWMQPAFDDGSWWRQPGPFYGGEVNKMARIGREVTLYPRYGYHQPISMALLCLRGKFMVSDPAQVKALELALTYRGGVTVYLNGKEVARRHLPKGEIRPETLADDYPLAASFTPKGAPRWSRDCSKSSDFKLRVREAKDLRLPPGALRKGVNILAIEIHRAAQRPEFLNPKLRRSKAFNSLWSTAGFINATLTAEGTGAVPNVSRPGGIRLWNAGTVESVFQCSYGDPHDPLRPIRISGARNGTFSGQIVVGSDGAITGLRARVSDLGRESGQGRIPAEAIRIRYARPNIYETGGKYVYPSRTHGTRVRNPSGRFDMLLDAPPADVKPGSWGAVQPVWLTVRVPADAAHGTYAGKLTVEAEKAAPMTVPVHLQVYDYRLPDPKDFQTSVGFLQFPETLASSFGVTLWSEKHWKLIHKSLTFSARMGNQTFFLPLIAGTHLRNHETMVRWIRKDGGYDCDFGLVERYLDMVLETGNSPKVLCLQVWDYHIGRNQEPLGPRQSWKIGTGMYGQSGVNTPQNAPVTCLDPQTGMLTTVDGPKYTDADAERFWRPVAVGIMEIIKERSLEQRVMLGIAGDYVPPKVTIELWQKLLPDVSWVTMAHGTTSSIFGAPVGYATIVFGAHFVDPDVQRRLGWKRPDMKAYFPRYADQNRVFGLSYERTFYEYGLCCGLRGAGRQNLDDFADRRKVNGCSWGSLLHGPAWLARGPDGPADTIRFEIGLEGVQECEARIFIEKALDDDALRSALGEALAERCRAIIDRRTRTVAWSNEQNTNQRLHCYLPGGPLGSGWYAGGSDWQGQSATLYATAAEVAKALKLFPAQ